MNEAGRGSSYKVERTIGGYRIPIEKAYSNEVESKLLISP